MQPDLLVLPQGEGSEQQVDIGGMKGEPTTSDKWYCLAPPS